MRMNYRLRGCQFENEESRVIFSYLRTIHLFILYFYNNRRYIRNAEIILVLFILCALI